MSLGFDKAIIMITRANIYWTSKGAAKTFAFSSLCSTPIPTAGHASASRPVYNS